MWCKLNGWNKIYEDDVRQKYNLNRVLWIVVSIQEVQFQLMEWTCYLRMSNDANINRDNKCNINVSSEYDDRQLRLHFYLSISSLHPTPLLLQVHISHQIYAKLMILNGWGAGVSQLPTFTLVEQC